MCIRDRVIPFQYGDIRFLSERWALGVMLEETSIRPCDYEDYIDGKNYNAISYDVYDLSLIHISSMDMMMPTANV